MKLIDKVVLFVFLTVLVAYIIYINGNQATSGMKKSLRIPLLKDKFVWKEREDPILRKAVDTIKHHEPVKPNRITSMIVKKPAVSELYLADPILKDGLKISVTKSNLQLNIIAENEKALIYWLTMARYAMIKKTDNTLVLFSNELDLSIPPYFQHFPFHRVPQNDNEMLHVLQSHGSYVMKAVLTGIVKRIIWIRPNWARTSTNIGPYQSQRSAFGIVKTQKYIKYCVCESNNCTVPGLSTKLSSTDCHLRISVLIEQIKETTFLTKLKDKSWLQQSDVLLHIDAAYFGYVSPTSVLLRVIPEKHVVEKIDNISRKLFCPHSIQEEIYLDRLLLKAIEYSLIEKECKLNNTSKVKTGPFANCKGVKMEDFKMEDEIYKFLVRKLDSGQYLCANYNHFTDFLIKEMSFVLKQRKVAQLGFLKLTGFCLSTTVKYPHGFGICKGAKGDGQSVKFMPTHITNGKEIQSKTAQFRLILMKIKNNSVKTITFCRNLRHGHAPRYYMPTIEASLLKTLNLSFEQFTLNYDRHILGHKPGWYYRSYLKDTL